MYISPFIIINTLRGIGMKTLRLRSFDAEIKMELGVTLTLVLKTFWIIFGF